MINWVWCGDCLDWKDAGNEVSFMSIEEDTFGKDVMTFLCDKCEKENKNNVIESATKPRGGRRSIKHHHDSFIPLTVEDAISRNNKKDKYR